MMNVLTCVSMAPAGATAGQEIGGALGAGRISSGAGAGGAVCGGQKCAAHSNTGTTGETTATDL
ncbi:MAG: hypothetical protein B7Y74_10430, partial [Novosphingobium sp. 35-62-5]